MKRFMTKVLGFDDGTDCLWRALYAGDRTVSALDVDRIYTSVPMAWQDFLLGVQSCSQMAFIVNLLRRFLPFVCGLRLRVVFSVLFCSLGLPFKYAFSILFNIALLLFP